MIAYAQSLGAPGLGYVLWRGRAQGPVAKYLDAERRLARSRRPPALPTAMRSFFVCARPRPRRERLVPGLIRTAAAARSSG